MNQPLNGVAEIPQTHVWNFWGRISPAIKLVGPWNFRIRVSYTLNYKTAISDNIPCWEGEQFPLISCIPQYPPPLPRHYTSSGTDLGPAVDIAKRVRLHIASRYWELKRIVPLCAPEREDDLAFIYPVPPPYCGAHRTSNTATNHRRRRFVGHRPRQRTRYQTENRMLCRLRHI